MFDNAVVVIVVPDRLDAARAALAATEQRMGVRSREIRSFGTHSSAVVGHGGEVAPNFDAPEPFTAFLDGGVLPAEAASVVSGSTSLLLALLAASQGPEWLAVVGMPTLGYLAGHDAGIDLSRVVAVPDDHGRTADVVAALLDGMAYVVVGPDARLTPAERRQLLARARDRGSGVVSTSEWEHAALRVHAQPRWSGVDHGAGWVRTCVVDVERQGRGAPEQWQLRLPMPGLEPFVPPEAGSASRRRRAALHAVG